MSEQRGFAHVRRAEVEALKRIKQPSAGIVWIAVRASYSEGRDFACGSRDFESFGVGRDAASAALKAFVEVGLLGVVSAGAFGRRGAKTVYRILHVRDAAQENTAGKPANLRTDTAGKPANNGRETRQLAENTAGKTDTPKEAPSASPSEPKDEGASRASAREALQAAVARIEVAAKAAALDMRSFINRAGGREPADFLARKFERGELGALQLATKLAEMAKGSAEGVIAAGSEAPAIRQEAAA